LFGPHDVALHHKRRYERAELEAKLRAAGLAPMRISFINMGLAPLAFDAALDGADAPGAIGRPGRRPRHLS
jgi:hypothetical protein